MNLVNYRIHPGASSERLLVLFTGWGMDDCPFLPMARAYDTAFVWDYADLSTPLPFLAEGRPIDLIAWSMGVWAATQVLPRERLATTLAINGTPRPIDDTYGIPKAIFEGTLAGLSEAGLTRFRRRMCGGGAALNAFLTNAPQRTLDDLHTELAALGEAITTRPVREDFRWDRAIACAEDRIFPLAAQQAAFPTATVVPGAHWAPDHFAKLLSGGACE